MRVSLTPDPRRGVFETMLVLDGEPVELDAHLERLAGSVSILYRAELPSDVVDRVREGAGGLACGKLRATITPGLARAGRESLDARVAAEKVDPAAVFPGVERGIALRSFPLESGLGEHKWADRRLLEGAESALSPGELALLVDGNDAALEASRGSLFAVGEGWLATPPADGRILPGIARRLTIEVSRQAGIEVREETLTADSLHGREAFLAGSVRGIEPVLALDGVALPPPGALSRRVADELRGRWLRAPRGEPAAAAAGGQPAGPRAR